MMNKIEFWFSINTVNWAKKNTIFTTTGTTKYKVLKVYKLTWWKKLLIWLSKHYDIPYHPRINQVKVKQYG